MLNSTIQLYKKSFSGLSPEVWSLSGVMLINRAGAMVLPFLSVYLTQQLGFTLAQTGWIMSCFGAGSVLGSYAGGKLTDRIGFYDTQFWSLLLSGFAFIAIQWVETFYAVAILVFVASAIADTFRPAGFAAIAAYSKEGNRTRAIALLRMAINLGWAVGPAAGGLLAANLGYHWLFWVDGLTCIAAALFFRRVLPRRRRPVEDTAVAAAGAEAAAYRNRAYLLFLLFAGLNAIAFMQLFSTLPVFFKEEVSLHEGQIGQLMAMNGLIIALLEMPLIYLLERRFRILRLISAGTLLMGAGYLAFLLIGPQLGAALLCMLLLTFGEIFSMPFISTMALQFTNDRNRGQYMALFTVMYSVSHIVAPNLGMQLAGRGGFPLLWVVLIGLTVAAAAGFILIGEKQQRAEHQPAPSR